MEDTMFKWILAISICILALNACSKDKNGQQATSVTSAEEKIDCTKEDAQRAITVSDQLAKAVFSSLDQAVDASDLSEDTDAAKQHFDRAIEHSSAALKICSEKENQFVFNRCQNEDALRAKERITQQCARQLTADVELRKSRANL
jgi:hypothetical protein